MALCLQIRKQEIANVLWDDDVSYFIQDLMAVIAHRVHS